MYCNREAISVTVTWQFSQENFYLILTSYIRHGNETWLITVDHELKLDRMEMSRMSKDVWVDIVGGLQSKQGTRRCLQKEMATYRHWSVSLWRDPDDVSQCRILYPNKTAWRLISATLCGWRRCFMADQLWLTTRIEKKKKNTADEVACSFTVILMLISWWQIFRLVTVTVY